MEDLVLTEVYKKYPQLEDIATRLEESKQQAEQKNKERKIRDTGNSSNADLNSRERRANAASMQHGVIEKFLSNGNWQETYHMLSAGREKFEENLLRILKRNPDALTILLVNGSKITQSVKPTKIQVVLQKEAVIPEPDKKENEGNSEVVKKIEQQLHGLQEQMQLSSKQPIDSNNAADAIKSLDFAQQLKEIQYTNNIEILKRDHKDEVKDIRQSYEKEIEELNETIEELEDEIADLQEELADTDSNLNGIEQKIKEAQNPPIIGILGKIASKAMQEFAKKNVDGISQFAGVDKDDLKKYFADLDLEEKRELSGNKGTEATFSEVTGNSIYPTLSPEKKEFADAFIKFTNTTAIEDLRVIVSILQLAIAEDGEVNKLILAEMLNTATKLSDNLNNPE